MADYYLVERVRGSHYDPSRRRREQEGWDEHAAFMDDLVNRGVIVLGGPVGDVDRDETALLVMKVDSDAEARAALATDPWEGRILEIGSVKPWTVWLRGTISR